MSCVSAEAEASGAEAEVSGPEVTAEGTGLQQAEWGGRQPSKLRALYFFDRHRHERQQTDTEWVKNKSLLSVTVFLFTVVQIR